MMDNDETIITGKIDTTTFNNISANGTINYIYPFNFIYEIDGTDKNFFLAIGNEHFLIQELLKLYTSNKEVKEIFDKFNAQE